MASCMDIGHWALGMGSGSRASSRRSLGGHHPSLAGRVSAPGGGPGSWDSGNSLRLYGVLRRTEWSSRRSPALNIIRVIFTNNAHHIQGPSQSHFKKYIKCVLIFFFAT